MERFRSICFDGVPPALPADPPAYFADLQLDRIVAAVAGAAGDADGAGFDSAPYFHLRLTDEDAVRYRQDVVRDLAEGADAERLRTVFAGFAAGMADVRATAAEGTGPGDRYEREGWTLEAVRRYLDTVERLHADLAGFELRSAALAGLRDHLTATVTGETHRGLRADHAAVAAALRGVEYTVALRGSQVRVAPRHGDPAADRPAADHPGADHPADDYGAEIAETFARFRIPDEPPRVAAEPPRPGMGVVQARILGAVAALHPEPFHRLHEFCGRHADFVDPVLAVVDRELRFYLGYLGFVRRLRAAGLPMSLPTVTAAARGVAAQGTVDLALATALLGRGEAVVGNDLDLTGGERIAVITGPNEGGKTALARAYGQLHHLAALGLPVPGERVRVGLCDGIFTHFDRGEDAASLHGRLENDILALHAILTAATESSVIVLNETFSSTTLRDAKSLGGRILDRMIGLGARCAYVTFVDDLADAGPAVVGLVSTVAADNPSVRTYRVVRRRSSGPAYAELLARRYGLDHDALTRRIRT